jgi:hypothetical protein
MRQICSPVTQRLFAIALAIVAISTPGCGGSSPKLVEVRGRITDGGKAVAGANVTYQPIATSKDDIFPGPGSFGKTDADGHYQLRTFNHELPGAIPGQHRISISLPPTGEVRDFAPAANAKAIPARFLDGSTIVVVPTDGAAELNFDLAQSGPSGVGK